MFPFKCTPFWSSFIVFSHNSPVRFIFIQLFYPFNWVFFYGLQGITSKNVIKILPTFTIINKDSFNEDIFGSSSLTFIKCPENYNRSNSQQFCSWYRKPQTILKIRRKVIFSKVIIILIIHHFFKDFTNRRMKTKGCYKVVFRIWIQIFF